MSLINIIKRTLFLSLMETIEKILQKSLEQDLNLNEIGFLLNCSDDYYDQIIHVADNVTKKIFSNKIMFYVPLYIDSFCANNCLYCDYRRDNEDILRKKLSFNEFKKEVEYLDKQGYTMIEIVSSTDFNFPFERLKEFVKYLKEKNKITLMNNRPLQKQEYIDLKESGLDWSWLWMESYIKEHYQRYHPQNTEKYDFEKRTISFEDMASAGLNVGFGFLLGLTPDFNEEVLSTIKHAKTLKQKYNIKVAFGTPRFCSPNNAPLKNPPYPDVMTDEKFRLMIALYRLAIRDSYINVSTREDINMLKKLWLGGGNLTNPEVQTIPGGYSLGNKGSQFQHNSYSCKEFTSEIKKLGLIPIL